MIRICREGWPFVGTCAGLGLFMLLMSAFTSIGVTGWLGVATLLAGGFCAYFFRDPIRRVPTSEGAIVSPADGKILEIQGNVVRIFLSIFDVHIQRSPIAGRIRAIRYTKGKFLDARDPKAASVNEQNRIEIAPAALGAPNVVVTQIAGKIARRIVCWVKEGHAVKQGEQIGMIRFGSQVDIELPPACRLCVKAGDRVFGGETILAELA